MREAPIPEVTEDGVAYRLGDRLYNLVGVNRYICRIYPSLDTFKGTRNTLAIDEGKLFHSKVEDRLNGKPTEGFEAEMKQFEKFRSGILRDHSLVATEITIWSEDMGLIGVVDAVFRDPDGRYTVVDWKRSSTLDKYPLTLTKYKVQLSFYQRILEKHYDMEVSSLIIAAFHQSMSEYKYFRFTPYTRVGYLTLPTMITYGEFVRVTDRYIKGHEKSPTYRFLTDMKFECSLEDCTLEPFEEVDGVKFPLLYPIRLRKHLDHPLFEEILDTLQTVKCLSERDMKSLINERDCDGQTLLMDCAVFGYTATVECLIRKGANINCVNRYNMTALVHAINMRHEEIALLLVRAGAKRTRFEGKTVTQFARERGLEQVVSAIDSRRMRKAQGGS